MKNLSLAFLLLPICIVVADASETNLESIIQSRSTRPLLQQSTEVQQTEERAQNFGGYAAEVRPRITDDVAGLALRIYLPQTWGRGKHLTTQIALLAESRQLLVSEEEWKNLMQAYRLFSDLRMFNQQIALLETESKKLKKDLARAEESLAKNQYSLLEYARLEAVLLDELNALNKLRNRQLSTRRSLQFLLGEAADLDQLAQSAIPPKLASKDPEILIQKALQNRSDYRQMQVQARSLETSEILAQSKNGFRLKYLQPEYSKKYSGDHEDRWGLSASFVLPWGQNHLDTEVFQQRRNLLQSEISISRERIAERVRILFSALSTHTSAHFQQDREAATQLSKKMEEQLSKMDTEHLEQLRDLTILRKRITENRLQTLQDTSTLEHLQIDLAEEIGSF